MILLTGGTGFLGRHLVPALCRDGHEVRLLTRQPHAYPWLAEYHNLTVVTGDLQDAGCIHTALSGCRTVIHAGGKFRFWGDPREFYETNLTGTRHLLEAAAAADIEQFIHISTIAVVGQPPSDSIIDETYPPHPADPYQKSKWEAEQQVRAYHEAHGLPVVVLRPGAYYGPLGLYGFNRLFFKDPMRGIIMQVDGGRYIIFPAYIQDVVQGILRAMARGQAGEVYNICGDWISHREVFDIVCDEARLPWPRLPIPGWLGIQTARLMETTAALTRQEPFWPLNLRSYVYNNWRVSNEKARRELGFEPTSFHEGARATIAWYRAGQPDRLPELACP